MAWRIDEILIRNFKFFHGEFTISPKGKNVILYGENGAGKSSIYWSVYTHLQACLKSPVEAKKYFIAGNDENLRNRFARADETSEITVTVNNGTGTRIGYTDGSEECYVTDSDSREFIKATAFGSDFMNYKFLSSLFDFDNSKPNEVFPIIEKHILPFLNFRETRKDFGVPEYVDTGDSNAATWYEWLKSTWPRLPKGRRRRFTNDPRSPEFKHFKSQLKRFNELLSEELREIIFAANARLRDPKKFDTKVELIPDYKYAYWEKGREGKFIAPSILLHARMLDDGLEDRSVIRHPKSFFNEAKITSMALAIRLAIFDRRAAIRDGASALFIDDMLISLDMGLRRRVLPMILEYTRTHQLFILTHDRGVFKMIREFVEHNEGKKDKDGKDISFGIFKEDWTAYELFVKDGEKGPEAFLKKKRTHLERAQAHLRAFNIPECANALRQCCEAQLKNLLGSYRLYALNDKGELSDPKLANLIDSYEQQRKKRDFPDIVPSIDGDRSRIMNPFSHDDIETPYYREELRLAVESMERLCSVKRYFPVKYEDIGDPGKLYSLECRKYWADIDRTFTIKCIFFFKEVFDVWEYEGVDYPANPLVCIVDIIGDGADKVEKLKGSKKELRALVIEICKCVSISSEDAKDWITQVKRDGDNKFLVKNRR